MAPLIAYRLAQRSSFRTRAKICGVYTYGAPRVANGRLVERYNDSSRVPVYQNASIDIGSVTFRYQLADDPVPHVPPNVPSNDGRKVAELVAEELMSIVRSFAPELAAMRKRVVDTEGKLDGLTEPGAELAGVVYGAGNFLLEVYDLMDTHGVLDVLEGLAYRKAKHEVMDWVAKLEGLQHLGHTRWIQRLSSSKVAIAAGDPSQHHHLSWMMSFSENFVSAACADKRTGTSENLKQQMSNALGFHRTPFYAAVLLMHTRHGGADGRFAYPDSDVNDRLMPGISLHDHSDCDLRLESLYDADRETFLGCGD